MASRGTGAKAKGAQFERTIATRLTELLDSLELVYKRGLGQARGAISEGADVQCEELDDYFHFELKNHKRSPIKPALEQAKRDKRPTAMPIVITKDAYKPVLVTMEMSDWEPMFKLYVEHLLNAVAEGTGDTES